MITNTSTLILVYVRIEGIHILDVFRQCGVVCFSFRLWLILHDLYGGTYLGSVQTVWCCLQQIQDVYHHISRAWSTIVKKKNKQHPLWTDARYVPPYKSCMINHSQKEKQTTGWSFTTYMVVHILDLFREGVVCFSIWLWLIMHDLYGGTYLASVQRGCCLFFFLTMVY
jgi:hypothetical protein